VLPRKPASKAARAAAVKNADDAELQALDVGLNVDVALDDALFDDRIAEMIADATDPMDDAQDSTSTAIEDAVRRDDYSEGLIGLASEVIAARIHLLGTAYPFELNGNRMRYIGSKTYVYEFCLTASNVSNIADTPFRPALMLFEQLSGLVMSCFLGSMGQYHHTGYPGSGVTIGGHLPTLNAVMPEEWRWDSETLKAKRNDGGVDVVVWKRADDRQDVGSLIFVGNAGCGKNWNDRGKHRERPSDALDLILSRPKSRHLHDFLSLPFHIFDVDEWIEASDEGRFVLDRIRLAAIAEVQEAEIWKREASKLALSLPDAVRLLHPTANIPQVN